MSSTPTILHQVGGHTGLLSRVEEDGSLLVKHALSKELAFYQAVASNDALEALRPTIPRFYGTLKLEGKVDTQAETLEATDIKPVEGLPHREFIVLDDLTYHFDKPNVLDVKLGTVMYDEDATPEKRARMERSARETTSEKTGIRLTGFQVHDLNTDKPVVVSKDYGKSLKPETLPQGIARFFPLAISSSPSAATESSPATGTGLPVDILLPILRNLREDIEEIHDRLAQVHLRMRSASLLVIYEADWERAREGLRILGEAEQKGEGETAEEDKGDGDDSEEEEEEDERLPLPYTVKLIDFAHTRLAPGEGPDEGVLKGLKTFMTLLDGRIQEIQKQT